MAKITSLCGQFDNQKDLISYADAAFLAIKSANDRIKDLEEKNKDLLKMVDALSPTISGKVSPIIKSPELIICESQLRILENRALQMELTLDEVKTYDLLCKNKRLIMGEATTIEGEKKTLKVDFTEAQLVEIAQTPST